MVMYKLPTSHFHSSLWNFPRKLSVLIRKIYATYCVQEKAIMLDKLSNSSIEELSGFSLSPQLIRKIVAEREINGTFKSLSDVHGFDGQKLKVLEKIVGGKNHLLKELQAIIASKSSFFTDKSINDQTISSTTTKNKTKELNLKKMYNSIIGLSSYNKEELNTFTTLRFSLSQVAWTKMDKDRQVLDMSCADIDIDMDKNLKSIDSYEFYEKVSLAFMKIPESDLVVLETVRLHFANYHEVRLHNMSQGILLTLLDKRENFIGPHPLVFMKDTVVSSLFNIQVGGERISGMGIGESILAGKSSLNWIMPLHFSSEPLQKYILSTYHERRQMVESFLAAIAFSFILFHDSQSSIHRVQD